MPLYEVRVYLSGEVEADDADDAREIAIEEWRDFDVMDIEIDWAGDDG